MSDLTNITPQRKDIILKFEMYEKSLRDTPFEHVRFITPPTEDGIPQWDRGLGDRPVMIGLIAERVHMTLSQHQRCNWRLLHASHGITGHEDGEVIIPADVVDIFTDEELGRVVRQAVKYAELARLEGEARKFNTDWNGAQRWRLHGYKDFGYTYAMEFEATEKWAAHSQEITEYVSRVRPILEGRNNEAGFIYCLSDGVGHYKIGRTKNLNRRVSQLSTQPPFPIELVWAFQAVDAAAMEAHLHQSVAAHRLNGEWFALTQEQVESIQAKVWVETFVDIQGEPLPESGLAIRLQASARKQQDVWPVTISEVK